MDSDAEPKWERAYREAVLETDPQKLAGKLDAAAAILRDRSSELNLGLGSAAAPAPDGQQIGREKQQISDALRTLETIRKIEFKITA